MPVRIPSALRSQGFTINDGRVSRPALRFKKAPTTGLRRLVSNGSVFIDVNASPILNILTTGVVAKAAGTASIRPAALGRISDPASDGDETSLDVANAAGTVLARLSAYRFTATSWGWKLYTSVASALAATPALQIDGNNRVTLNGQLLHNSAAIGTIASYFSFLDSAFSAAVGIKVGSLVTSASYSDTAPTNGIYSAGQVTIGGTSSIVPAPAPGTPLANGLYRENTPKAWAHGVTTPAGGSNAGTIANFGFSAITRQGSGLVQFTFATAAPNTNYFIIGQSGAGAAVHSTKTTGGFYTQFNSSDGPWQVLVYPAP